MNIFLILIILPFGSLVEMNPKNVTLELKYNLTDSDIANLNVISRAEMRNLYKIWDYKTTFPSENQILNLTCNRPASRLFVDNITMLTSMITNGDKRPCNYMLTDILISKIKNDCINKQRCVIPLTNDLFLERCSLRKGLSVLAYCLEDKFNDIITSNTCVENLLTLSCDSDKVLSIVNAKYGRWESSSICASLTESNSFCYGVDSTSTLQAECNNKRRCQFQVNSTLGNICPGISKYLEVKYRCIARPKMTNPCVDNPCGFGAVCRSFNGLPICSCPAGSKGDPNVRCCKSINCYCWGDPHCVTFDKSKFDFMGRCKYELVSTNCYNQTLPNGIIPFSVNQKHELRNGKTNVAFIQYVDINVFNRQYRLLKKENNTHKYTIDGIVSPNDYEDKLNGVKIYLSGGNIVFSTQFGLTVSWNGDHWVDVYLCDTYSSYVCGLCGNADGVSSNDFVDRSNSLIDTNNTFYNNSIFKWANKWRVPDDSNTIDLDKSRCNPLNDPGVEPPPVKCANSSLYMNNNWCGIIKNSTGPWSQCLTLINSNVLNGIYEGCLFDICATESQKQLQEEYRCKAYEQIAQACNNLVSNVTINWRSITNCPKTCGLNEIYALRSECPRTCLDQLGKKGCGEIKPVEGCYCKDGFVLNSNGLCIPVNECGCLLPDESAFLSIGQSFKANCTVKYICNGTLNVELSGPCSQNASCLADQNGQPQCVCIKGYIGDGYNCILGTPSVSAQKAPIPCYNRFISDDTITQNDILNNLMAGTSKCGLSSQYFNLENVFDQEFSECREEKTCLGYGDPYYRTLDQNTLMINNACSYVLASDFCEGNSNFNYIIYVDHENRYNYTKSTFIKKVSIFFNNKFYEITNKFSINSLETSLPYESKKENVYVMKQDVNIVFKTNLFTLQFDGFEILRFNQCGKNVCGLCFGENSDLYLVQDFDRACLINP